MDNKKLESKPIPVLFPGTTTRNGPETSVLNLLIIPKGVRNRDDSGPSVFIFFGKNWGDAAVASFPDP
jgi:hypothetical protein